MNLDELTRQYFPFPYQEKEASAFQTGAMAMRRMVKEKVEQWAKEHGIDALELLESIAEE